MTKLEQYNQFLLSKVCIAQETGLDIEIPIIKFNDGTELKPHQRDAINWAIRGGRRALFESFGLGKTIQQLIICNVITNEIGGKALIVCPLGVKGEFYNDAQKKLGREIVYVRNMHEVEKAKNNILITNYERVRDGDIDPKYFTVTSLDEASVLRSYGSKTYQTFLDKFKGVKYKYVCTATPSPNKYKELIHYAGYLEIMDTGQALTRFFKRDSTKANNLTLHEHKQKEFWLWLSSWALFITKPSDLGYDDTGYDLPAMKVIYHKVKVDHGTAGTDQDGQVKLFRDAALGLKDAAREKRESLNERVDQIKDILLTYEKDLQVVIWADLNNEQQAIEKMLKSIDVSFVSLYGHTDIETREIEIQRWKDNEVQVFLSKPEMYGSGVNLQQCHVMIFAGINYEFNSFIQAIHRIYRFLQDHEVNIHVIYAESEGEILKTLQRKWKQHEELVENMVQIIKENGLSNVNTMDKLKRSIISEAKTETGQLFTAILSDCVPAVINMPDNSIHLGVTSIPFANHYEYTPTYNDFGHTQDNEHFFRQMDYLTPELLRVLMPGRVFCVHVKDRILFGNATGTGMPTLDPFSDFTVLHFIKHGFQYMGRITIETDVVRENNQTYRLGWTEQCKDGSKMGVGCPEYVLLFRKLPSDTSRAYADIPVSKPKEDSMRCIHCYTLSPIVDYLKRNNQIICPKCEGTLTNNLVYQNKIAGYTRGQWQIDARAKWNSSGERFLTPDEIRQLPIDKINRYYSDYAAWKVYDYKSHCDTAEQLNHIGKLPATFQTLNIPSRSFFVWDDVNRMLTLNGTQSQRKLNMHICLAKGSLILTKSGFKPIESIGIGDLVLTHKGNWKPVIAKKCTGVNHVVQTKAQGVANLITTPDHKLWTRKPKQVRCKDFLKTTNPEWIEAKDTKGGWVNIKLPNEIPSNLSYSDWWIVGRYLADGHTGVRGDFFISVGNHKRERFENQAQQYIGSKSQRSAIQYRLKNLPENLKEILRKCGKGADNKQVPVEGLCLDNLKSEALLAGYLSGDGHRTGNQVSASSVSRALLLGLAMVAQRTAWVIPSIFKGKPEGKHTIEGREVNQKQLWVLSYRNGKRSFGELLEDGAWKKVREIKDAGKAETWSIQVADDESYTAEGCIVKNCPLQFDIVDRCINRFSNKGEVVFDPFAGLFTVPVRAIKMGRFGIGTELNPESFRDGLRYCREAETEVLSPTLFGVFDSEIKEAI
jgi:hypothetical protein